MTTENAMMALIYLADGNGYQLATVTDDLHPVAAMDGTTRNHYTSIVDTAVTVPTASVAREEYPWETVDGWDEQGHLLWIVTDNQVASLMIPATPPAPWIPPMLPAVDPAHVAEVQKRYHSASAAWDAGDERAWAILSDLEARQ